MLWFFITFIDLSVVIARLSFLRVCELIGASNLGLHVAVLLLLHRVLT